MADRDARRFEFGWLEVMGLVVLFLAGSGVVFFLGVYVGKGLQESRIQREERVVRLPIGTPGPEGDAAPREADLPLYNELAERGQQATPGVALAVKRGSEPTVVTTPVVAATLGPRASAGALPAATPLARASVAARPTPAHDEIVRSSQIPAAPTPVAGRPEATRDSQGSWSVQVNATKDEALARSLVRQLQERGYGAYLVKVSLQGDAWYRVRVGRFPTMEAATAVVMRLKNEERYSRAFLVND